MGDAAQGAEAIGQVQTLTGGASVVRANGVTETLNIGDPVFQGDVIMTGPGAKLGIGFVDGTVFSLSANARMVLNSLVYDPDGSNNSMLFSLVEGTFVFASGKIAPTGDMQINTPVATMGIRGTAPTVEIISGVTHGGVNFSLIPDINGHVGSYVLRSLTPDADGTFPIIGTISTIDSKWQLTSASGQIIEVEKTQEDLLNDAEAIGQINNVFNSWQSSTSQVPQAGPEGNNPPNSGGLNTTPPNPVTPGGEGNPGGDGGGNPPPGGNENPPPSGPPGPPQGNLDDPPPPPPDPTGGTGVNVINGTPFDDNGEEGNPPEILGTSGNDFIFGFAGNDVITAFAGDDFVDAGEGDDIIIAGTGEGDDDYDGGEGYDTIIYSSTSLGIVINLVDGTVMGPEIGFDTIVRLQNFVAGDGNDTFIFAQDTGWSFDGGDGIDTVRVEGDLDIDTSTFQSEVDHVEIIDLNQDGANTLTISVDDIRDDAIQNSMQIRGGDTDTVNLTNEVIFADDDGYDIGTPVDGLFEGSWQQAGTTVIDGLTFNIYNFVDYNEQILATANIEQGIVVNTPLSEGFENGFAANSWQTINAEISPANSTEGKRVGASVHVISERVSPARRSRHSRPDGRFPWPRWMPWPMTAPVRVTLPKAAPLSPISAALPDSKSASTGSSALPTTRISTTSLSSRSTAK